jgi:hypothetical protein
VTKNKERCGRHRFVLFCHNSFDNECKRNKTRNRIVVGLSIVSVPHPPQLLNDLLIPIAMIGENSNPRGMNIFWYKVRVKLKEYWKALKEYDSGN